MMDGSGEDNAEADYHSLVTRSAGEYVPGRMYSAIQKASETHAGNVPPSTS